MTISSSQLGTPRFRLFPLLVLAAASSFLLLSSSSSSSSFMGMVLFVQASDWSSRPPLTECDCPRQDRLHINCITDRTTCICMRRDYSSFYCHYGLCCSNRRRHRRGLFALSSSSLQPAESNNNNNNKNKEPIWISNNEHETERAYQMYLEKCGNLDYHVHLYVDSHLYAYATPGLEATAAGCPFVATYATFETNEDDEDDEDETGGGGATARKELVLFPDIEQGHAMLKEGAEASRSIGTFPLSRLAHAYQQAHVAGSSSADDVDDEYFVYDAIANNCGHYMLHLGAELGVKIDSNLVQFVARRLVQSAGQELANKIRDSVHYLSLFSPPRRYLTFAAGGGDHHAGNAPSNEELIEKLVHVQASGLM